MRARIAMGWVEAEPEPEVEAEEEAIEAGLDAEDAAVEAVE